MLKHAAPQVRLVCGSDCISYGMAALIALITRNSFSRFTSSGTDQNHGETQYDDAAVGGHIAHPRRWQAADQDCK